VLASEDESLEILGYRPNDDRLVDAKFLCTLCRDGTADTFDTNNPTTTNTADIWSLSGRTPCQNGGICDPEGYCRCTQFYEGYQVSRSYSGRYGTDFGYGKLNWLKQVLHFWYHWQCGYSYNCMEIGCFHGGTCNQFSGVSAGNLFQFPVEFDFYFRANTTCLNRGKCQGMEQQCECAELSSSY
jgi:hypothetical protein